MNVEWASAGWSRRLLFAVSALYWLLMLALFAANVLRADSGYQAGIVLGFYFTPLFLAAVIRAGYVLLSRRRPRPPFWSWWLFVTGAAIGVLVAVQRAVAIMAERAA